MDPLIFLISLVILPPPLDAGGQNNFLFYGGSLVVSPEGNRSHEVEVRSRQATVHCHVNRFSCQSGACGSVAAASAGKIGGDSFGLTWCLQEFRSRLRLGGGGGTALEIRFPTAVSAADSSGYWIPNTRSSSAAWRMKARLDLGIRSDTGEPNRPPVTTIPPILRTPRNCGRTFRLTVFDADGDRVRCRVPTEDGGWECGLCGLPGGFSLDQDSCSVTYSYDGLTGFHAIELVLEDFPPRPVHLSSPDGAGRQRPDIQQGAPAPLSTLPLQFTVLVDSHEAPSCLHGDYSPVFLAPTPANRANLPAFVNRTLELEVRAAAQYTTIRDLIVSGPAGISRRSVATGIHIIRWTPAERHLLEHIPVCFISEARDAYNRVYQSEPRCVTVHVGHHEAVVSCNQTSMTVELERTYFVRRTEDSLRLQDSGDASCSLKSRSNATHLVAVLSLGACGTHVEEDEDTIVFRNRITSSGSGDIISRHHDVDIAVSCIYPKKANLTLGFRHKNPYAFSQSGFGSFSFQFEFFQSQLFRRQVEGSSYPVEVSLKQMVYMQIQASSSIPDTQLFVESCRATPYDNPESRVSYTIMEDGCVRDPTVQVYPGPGSVFQFGMEAFEFIGAHDEVYITCSVLLCQSGMPNTRCSQGCLEPGSGRSRREAGAQTKSHFISQGPLRLRAPHSEGSIPTLNLVSLLVLFAGGLLACGAGFFRSRRTPIKYHLLVISETDQPEH